MRCTGKLLKVKSKLILIPFTSFVEGQDLAINQFVVRLLAITHYVAAYKTVKIYYLKKSHDLLNRSYD